MMSTMCTVNVVGGGEWDVDVIEIEWSWFPLE